VSVLLAAAAMVGACSAPDVVQTERADRVDDADTPVGTPDAGPTATATDAGPAATSTTTTVAGTGPTTPTTPGDPAPDGTAVSPSASVDDGADDGRAPRLGAGDELFPELGSSDVDVESYDVRLAVDPAADTISGSVGIVAEVRPGVDAMPLDAVGLDVTAVTVEGAPADFEQLDTELLVDLPEDRGRRVDAVIEYAAAPDSSQSRIGLPVGWFQTPGGSYVLNEPDGARRWLPSNDHPSDKATWRFEIDVPDPLVAVANGELVTAGDGAGSPWVWEESEPMPTYLVQLIVGDYDVVEDEPLVDAEGDTVPIVHAVPAGAADDFEVYARTIESQVPFFEERFGPYPLDRYGLAFIDSVGGVAMETLGRSQFSTDDFSGRQLGETQQLLLAHELAHQWFGDAVTPARWEDIWLNESFATYAQWLWLDEVGLQDLDTVAARTLEMRQGGGRPTGRPEAANLFGFESYDGGAVVVHALRRTMGDEAFFDLLRTWIATYAGTSQTSDAFEALASDVHGADLTAFFDAWLYATDLPDEYPA
jgi:aminopeptidase N